MIQMRLVKYIVPAAAMTINHKSFLRRVSLHCLGDLLLLDVKFFTSKMFLEGTT